MGPGSQTLQEDHCCGWNCRSTLIQNRFISMHWPGIFSSLRADCFHFKTDSTTAWDWVPVSGTPKWLMQFKPLASSAARCQPKSLHKGRNTKGKTMEKVYNCTNHSIAIPHWIISTTNNNIEEKQNRNRELPNMSIYCRFKPSGKRSWLLLVMLPGIKIRLVKTCIQSYLSGDRKSVV